MPSQMFAMLNTFKVLDGVVKWVVVFVVYVVAWWDRAVMILVDLPVKVVNAGLTCCNARGEIASVAPLFSVGIPTELDASIDDNL